MYQGLLPSQKPDSQEGTGKNRCRLGNLAEYEMGQSLAQTILFHNNVDVFQLDKNVSIVEMKIPSVWAGQSLSQLDLRGKYNLNVLGLS